MAHQRKKIRQHLANILLNTTAAGANVFPRRATPLWKVTYPVIMIYAREEDAKMESSTLIGRTLKIGIDIRAIADEQLDDVLDDIATEVEAIVDADRSLGNNALTSYITKTEIEVGADGENDIGACRLTYDVIYDS